MPNRVNPPNHAKAILTEPAIVAPRGNLPGRGSVERPPMGPKACREYAEKIRPRYQRAGRKKRGELLDEFTRVTGYHRKYAIAVLGRSPRESPMRRPRGSRFSPEVTAILIAIWRAADYPWSARLVALLPLWMPWARVRLSITAEIEAVVLSISARSADRLLHSHRTALKRRLYSRTKPGTLLKHQIPIRSERWDVTEAGWCETDTVAHCGDCGDGEFAHSVNLTDVASTWTETRAVLGKGQRFVVEALEDMRLALPFVLRGLDSDSGSEFINYHCVDWCKQRDLQFTRSRPYHKNDNAHIEQKNWTHVRKMFGWKRIDDADAIAAMNALYRTELRLFMNYFQPSVKLLERIRIGSRVRRKYDAAKTPFERLVELGALSKAQEASMKAERASLDPFALSETIEARIRAILIVPHSSVVVRAAAKAARFDGHFSRKSALAEAQREAVPVRTYVAR